MNFSKVGKIIRIASSQHRSDVPYQEIRSPLYTHIRVRQTNSRSCVKMCHVQDSTSPGPALESIRKLSIDFFEKFNCDTRNYSSLFLSLGLFSEAKEKTREGSCQACASTATQRQGIMRNDRVLARARPRTIEAIDREARQTTSTSACLSSSRCHRGHPYQTQNLPSLCLRVPSSSSLVCVIIFSPRIVIYPLDSCGCAPINPYSSF